MYKGRSPHVIFIERSTDTPIRPKDIDSDSSFTNMLGQRRSEVAAYWVVRYCQARRSWKPFLFDNLAKFCGHHDQQFSATAHSLLLEGMADLVVRKLVQSDKGIVTLSTSFVARCYENSPIPGLPRKRRLRSSRARVRSRYERLLEESLLV